MWDREPTLGYQMFQMWESFKGRISTESSKKGEEMTQTDYDVLCNNIKAHHPELYNSIPDYDNLDAWRSFVLALFDSYDRQSTECEELNERVEALQQETGEYEAEVAKLKDHISRLQDQIQLLEETLEAEHNG